MKFYTMNFCPIETQSYERIADRGYDDFTCANASSVTNMFSLRIWPLIPRKANNYKFLFCKLPINRI